MIQTQKRIAKVGASMLLGLACLSAGAEDHHALEKNAFKVSQLKEGFHFLQGRGGNILLSEGEDGLLLVDSDYADLSAPLEKTLSKFDRPLKYILNTHWHGDHTQGNKVLGHQGIIVAHDNVYERLNSRQEVKLFGMVSEPYPKHALPDITYDHRMTMHFNDHKISLLHFPNGHTDGDTVVLFKGANIVHMGDHFFNGFYPFVDVDSGGRVRGVAKNVTKLLAMIGDETLIVPGHGPMASKNDLIAFRDMLLGTASEVEALMASKSLEEIQSLGLSAQWDEWEDGFLNEKTWIKIVFDSLSAPKIAKGHAHGKTPRHSHH
jgi:cyclase